MPMSDRIEKLASQARSLMTPTIAPRSAVPATTRWIARKKAEAAQRLVILFSPAS